MSSVSGIGPLQNILYGQIIPPRQQTTVSELEREVLADVASLAGLPQADAEKAVSAFNDQKVTVNFSNPKNRQEENVLRLCSAMLRRLGFKTDTHQDIAEAITQFRAFRPLDDGLPADSLDISYMFRAELMKENSEIFRQIFRSIDYVRHKDNPFAERSIREAFVGIRNGAFSKIAYYQVGPDNMVSVMQSAETGAVASSDPVMDAIKTMLEPKYGVLDNNTKVFNAIAMFAAENKMSVGLDFDSDPAVTQTAAAILLKVRESGLSDTDILEVLFSETPDPAKLEKIRLAFQETVPSDKQDSINNIISMLGHIAALELTNEQVFQVGSLATEAAGKHSIVLSSKFISFLVAFHSQFLDSKEPSVNPLTYSGQATTVEVQPHRLAQTVDSAPIIAIKAALFSKAIPVSSLTTEGLSADDVRGVIRVFGQGGWVISAGLGAQDAKAISAVSELAAIKPDERALLSKIAGSQGLDSVLLTESEREILQSGKLAQSIRSITQQPSVGLKDDAGQAEIEQTRILLEKAYSALLKLQGQENYRQRKSGLNPEETAILREFAQTLESGGFADLAASANDKDGNSIFVLSRLRDAKDGLFNDGVRILRRIGWQLSEIVNQAPMAQSQDDTARMLTDSFVEGARQATASQRVKMSGIEITQMVAIKAVLFAKGGSSLILRMEELQKEIDASIQELQQIDAEISRIKKHLEDNGMDADTFRTKDPKGFEYYSGLVVRAEASAAKRQQAEQAKADILDYLSSARIDMRFWDAFKEKFPGANNLLNTPEMLAGTMLTDMNGRKVDISESSPFVMQDGTIVKSPFELVDNVIGKYGEWSSLDIVPGENPDITLAKKCVSLMLYQLSMFRESRAKWGVLPGVIPAGGLFPNLILKTAGAFGMRSDSLYTSVGATSDAGLETAHQESLSGRVGGMVTEFVSGLTGGANSPYYNVTPYLHLLVLQNSADPGTALVDLLSAPSDGSQHDVIGNMSRIDRNGVIQAREALRLLEEGINERLRRHPEWINQIHAEISKDPVLARALRINVELNQISFDFTPEQPLRIGRDELEQPETGTLTQEKAEIAFEYSLIDHLIENMGEGPISLFINPDDMENKELIPGARRLTDCMNAAFAVTGIIDYLESADPLTRPVTGYDVVYGLQNSGIEQFARVDSQHQITAGQHLAGAANALYSAPGSFAGTALFEMGKLGVFFSGMPLIFGARFTEMTNDGIDMVQTYISGDKEGARDKYNSLLKQAAELSGLVLRYSFDPTAFWHLVWNKLEEGTPASYAQATGMAAVVAGFSMYVAYRDYQLLANGARWMQGRQTKPIQYSFFDKPVDWSVRFASWVGNNALERAGLGQRTRYEYFGGRTWEEKAAPAFRRGWDRTKATAAAAGRRTMDTSKFPAAQISQAIDSGSSWVEKHTPDTFQKWVSWVQNEAVNPGVNKARRVFLRGVDIFWNDITRQRFAGRMYERSRNWTRENPVLNTAEVLKRLKADRKLAEELRTLNVQQPTRQQVAQVRQSLRARQDEHFREIGGELTGYEGRKEAGRMAEDSVTPRQEIQASFKYEPTNKGFELILETGDPRNVIFAEQITRELDASGVHRKFHVLTDAGDISIGLREVAVVQGSRIGYEVFTYEGGEKGVRLVVGQGLLLDQDASALRSAIAHVEEQMRANVHSDSTLVSDRYSVGGSIPEPLDLSTVKINGMTVDDVIVRINDLEPGLRNMTWDQLTQLSRQVAEQFKPFRDDSASTTDLLGKMDEQKFTSPDLELTGGYRPTFLEAHLAIAREMQRRITDETAQLGNGSGQVPKSVRQTAIKDGQRLVAGGKRLSAMQLRGILVMHAGNFANIYMGEGKSIVFAVLASTNAVTGRPQYFNTVDNATALAGLREGRALLDSMGYRTAAPSFNESASLTQKAFADADILFVSRSDLKFIELANRLAMNSRSRIDLDYRNGVFLTDECDFATVNEGKTPHLIAGPGLGQDAHAKEWRAAWATATTLLVDQDYRFADSGVVMTEAGKHRVNWDRLSSDEKHRLVQCLHAKQIPQGIQYEIKYFGDSVLLIDQSTGRLLEGREWSEGLHQAIQAKHGLTITAETMTIEQITEAEFARMVVHEVGASGTAKEIAAVLETLGRSVVEIERSVPEFKYRSEETFAENKARLDSLISERRGLDPEYDGKVQILCSAEEVEAMRQFRSQLPVQSGADPYTEKIVHSETVYSTRQEVVMQAADLVESARRSGDNRPIIIPIEDPSMAAALRAELKKRGINPDFLTHRDPETRYVEFTNKVWGSGEVLISTLIRRASDIKLGKQGGILISLEHSSSIADYLQKIGRAPRFGSNGEIYMLSSAEDQVYRQALDEAHRPMLDEICGRLADAQRQELARMLQDPKTTYADVLKYAIDKGFSGADIQRILDMASEKSNVSIFNEHFRGSTVYGELNTTLERMRDMLTRLQTASPEECLRFVIEEEVAAIAKRHGIEEGRSNWDMEGFKRELKKLLPARTLSISVAEGATAADLVRDVSARVQALYLDGTSVGIKTGLLTNPEKWRELMLFRFNEQRRDLMSRIMGLERKYGSRLEGSGMYEYRDGELVQEAGRSNLEDMKHIFESERENGFSVFRRGVLSELKRARSSLVRPIWWNRALSIDVSHDETKAAAPQVATEDPDSIRMAAGVNGEEPGTERAQVQEDPDPSTRPVQGNMDNAYREYLDLRHRRDVSPADIDSIARNNHVSAEELRVRVGAGEMSSEAQSGKVPGTQANSGGQSGSITESQASALQNAKPVGAPRVQEMARSIVAGLISPDARFVDPDTAGKIGSVTVISDADFDRINVDGDAVFVKGADGRYSIFVRRSAINMGVSGDLTPASSGRIARAVTHELAEIYMLEKNPEMPAAERSVAAHFAGQMVEREVSSGDPKLSFSSRVQRVSQKAHAVAEAMASDAGRSVDIGGAMGFGMSLIVYGLVPEIVKNGLDNVSTKDYWDASLRQSWDSAVRGAFFAGRDNLIQDYVSAVLWGTNYSKLNEWGKTSFFRKAGFTGTNLAAMAVSGILDDAVIWADSPISEDIKPFAPGAVKNADLMRSENPYIREYYYKMMTWKMIQGSTSNALFEAPQIMMTLFKVPANKASQFLIRTGAGVAVNMVSREAFERTILDSIRAEYLGENGKAARYAAGEIEYEDGLTAMHSLAQYIFSNPDLIENVSKASEFLSQPIQAHLLSGAAAQTAGRALSGNISSWALTGARKQVADRMIEETARRLAVKKLGEQGAVLSSEELMKQFGQKATQRVGARVIMAQAASMYYAGKWGFEMGRETDEAPLSYAKDLGIAGAGGAAIGVGTGILTFGFTKAALGFGPPGMLVAGAGFITGVAVQITDENRKQFEGIENVQKLERFQNLRHGLTLAERGWINGMSLDSEGFSQEEIRQFYPGLPEDGVRAYHALSRAGFSHPLGNSIPVIEEALILHHQTGWRDLGRDLQNIEEASKGVLSDISAGSSSYPSEEAFLDSALPNWRYLLSNESGERENFKAWLPTLYGCRTVKSYIEKLDSGAVIPRNMAGLYADTVTNRDPIHPSEFWDKCGLSPDVTPEEIETESFVAIEAEEEFFEAFLSEEEYDMRASYIISGDVQRASELANKARGNYLSLDNLSKPLGQDPKVLRALNLPIVISAGDLRNYPGLWDQIRAVLDSGGVLRKTCYEAGISNYSDLEESKMFEPVVSEALRRVLADSGKIVEGRIILDPETMAILNDRYSKLPPSPNSDVSLSDIATRPDIRVPLANVRDFPMLYDQIVSVLRRTSALRWALKDCGLAENVDMKSISDQKLNEVLTLALGNLLVANKMSVRRSDTGIRASLSYAFGFSNPKYILPEITAEIAAVLAAPKFNYFDTRSVRVAPTITP